MNLEVEGYTVITARTGKQALDILRTERPDLILMDVMLEDVSGIKLTGRIKNTPATADIPVIMLTAKDSDTDVVIGLGVGADDYVTKPFSTVVLAARIESVLKRAKPVEIFGSDAVHAGPLKMVPAARHVTLEGKTLNLTGGQFDILLALIKAHRHVLSRSELKETLGKSASGQKERIVDVHIAALRRKLGRYRAIIKTVQGKGYRADY